MIKRSKSVIAIAVAIAVLCLIMSACVKPDTQVPASESPDTGEKGSSRGNDTEQADVSSTGTVVEGDEVVVADGGEDTRTVPRPSSDPIPDSPTKTVDIVKPDEITVAPGTSAPDTTAPNTVAQFAAASYTQSFSDYENYVYTGTPSIPDYKIAAGLSNVVNYQQFSPGEQDWQTTFGFYHSANNLTDEAIAMIEQNGFAVSDMYSHREYFQIYEQNRYMYVPNFITTDSALHTFHLMFDYVLKDLEQNKLYGLLEDLSNRMVSESYAQFTRLKGTSFENAALRNTAFFSVASSLLNDGYPVPQEVSDVVLRELLLIEGQEGVAKSPVINMIADGGAGNGAPDGTGSGLLPYEVDYTQFITRSHYNQTEQLQAYFKAMMWYGQLTFRSASEDEVKSALLQTSVLENTSLSENWALIFEPTNFFVGECDDITWYQYRAALTDIYENQLGTLEMITDETKFREAFDVISRMQPPKINSVPVNDNISAEEKNAAITGYRFMGQRFTIDAYIFQNLIDDDVADRLLPNSLDIPAAFGSEAALELLADDLVMYPDYMVQMTRLRSELSKIPEFGWTKNLYWSWLYTLLPFADAQAGSGYPIFMQNSAWTQKELTAFQGSWTELKHDTLLYAKAAMAEMGNDVDVAPPDDRGYVEPNPTVYGRLAALVKQTMTGLETRGLLTAEAGEALGVLFDLSVRLTEISEKELASTSLATSSLSEEDYEFIRTFGGELEHIFDTAKHYELSQTVNLDSGEVVGGDMAAGMTELYLGQHPCGVIADVASGGGYTLEEATGFAKTIFVVFPRDGELVLGSGPVFSQYEFTVPIADRVTDEEWHIMMNEGNLPETAEWKRSFMCDVVQPGY